MRVFVFSIAEDINILNVMRRVPHTQYQLNIKYLGFIFSCSGSIIVGVRNLIKHAQKAWFSIKYYLSSSKNKNIDTYLTLFVSC